MKAKELVGKKAMRTQPALFVRESEIRTTRPEVLKIDDRFIDEIVKILEVTEHNILISVSNDMSHPFGFDREIKVVLPKYFLDGNWESAEPFEKHLMNECSRIRRVGEIDVDAEMAKMMSEDGFNSRSMSLEDEVRENVNSAFADVITGPAVDTDKVREFVDLIFPDGEIDTEGKEDDEIVLELISKLKGLKPDRAKEVLNIIVDVAQTMATDMLEQKERIQEKMKELNNERNK
jgi:hypothetical protein